MALQQLKGESVFAQMRKICANRVSRRVALFLACALGLGHGVAPVRALDITLAWDANTETNLAGYNLYYGVSSGAYTNKTSVGIVTNYIVAGLPNAARYVFALTAFDTAGNESDFSSEAVYVDGAPTISSIPNQTINEDSATTNIAFTVSDSTTPAANLTLTAASSNTSLIPLANIVLGGSGSNRTVMVTAAPNRSGSATITMTVSDGTSTSSSAFVVTVRAINDLPTISAVSNQTTPEDTPTALIAFTVSDVETPATNL